MVAAGVAAGLVALGAGFLVGRESAPDPVADDLGGLCGGTLPVAAARTFLESDHLAVTEDDGAALECDVAPAAITSSGDEHAHLSVVITPTDYAEAQHLVPAATSGNETAPFGHGWVGTYGADWYSGGNGGAAGLLVECAPEAGGGLLVVVEGSWDPGDRELVAQKHDQLAVVAARLARQVDQEWGCHSRLGEVPESVTVAEEGLPDTPVERAQGTCEGVVTAESARELGIEHVNEVPAGLGLAEDCLVRGAGETYYLTASYGPVADDRRDAPSADWPRATATASCGRGQGEGWYTGEVGESAFSQVEPPNRRAFQEMFDRFVAASAERHGCELDDDE
jgi:hypothetical protein